MPNPPRTTTAGQVFNDLRNRARREGRNTDELLVFYALERFLSRLSASQFASQFILKGGLLLAAFNARRPTRDADLVTYMDSAQEHVRDCLGQIMAIEADDGLLFRPEQSRAESIRENDGYAGLRIITPVQLGTAQIKLALDISFGDPVTPDVEQIDYPQLLSDDTFRLRAYPIETVLAEKIVTMVALGDLNTRDRDWADVWRLTGLHDIYGIRQREAIERTAEHRQVLLRPLSHVIDALPTRRGGPYLTWRRKQSVDGDAYPPTFIEVVSDVVLFADPLIQDNATRSRWSGEARSWT